MYHFLVVYLMFVLTSYKCFGFNVDTKNPIIYLDQSDYLSVGSTYKSSFFGLSVILYPGDNTHAPCYKCFGFNVDTKNPIIYLDQSDYLSVGSTYKSSFFGLSVILYPGDNTHAPWIQIGAPRSNSPTVKYRNPGIIFRCNIAGLCRYIEVDKEFGAGFSRGLEYFNNLNDAWIGASMDINMKFNRTVVCAPRWINYLRVGTIDADYRMLGACYWSDLHIEKFHKKIPLLHETYDVYSYKKHALYHYGQGEAGFAIHMPESANELLLGAPGVFNWKGTNILYKDKIEDDIEIMSSYTMDRLKLDPRKRSSSLSEQEIFGDANVASAITTTQLNTFSLSGYAVTSGHFFSKDSLLYVTGAPRAEKYVGKVLVYKFSNNHEESLDVKDLKQGTQFGEYFGAALAAGDIDNDGLDDLFVGAPYHRTSKFNEGRMYLFLGSKSGVLEDPFDGKFIDGTQSSSQFGTTITYLGKLNHDNRYNGPNYVAVSAPYEDTGGVVYIYRGTSNGLNTVPVQKIVGSSFLPNIKGFGISISKPVDIDGNGYEDIAIGAHESGHVVLLRSRPLVEIKTIFESIPDSIAATLKEFDITICHTYTSFRGNESIQMRRKIVVDEVYSRAIMAAGRNDSDIITLFMGRQFCEDVTMQLRKGSDIIKPLVINVTHSLIDEGKPAIALLISDTLKGIDEFCQPCGVYDEFRSVRTAIAQISFVLGCGEDNICMSALESEAQFRGVGVENNTFILGATNVIEINVVVKNRGEKAYLTRVQLDLPQGLSFKKVPTLCDQQGTRITCPVADPLDQDQEKTVALKLDMDQINSKNKENSVFINVTLVTNSYNRNNASKLVELKLKTEADISISGKSAQQSYPYDKDSTSTEFQQVYQIEKYGFSTIFLVRFEISIPYKIRTKSGTVKLTSLYQPEGIFGGQSIIFSSEIPYIQERHTDASEKNDPNKIQEIRSKRTAGDSEGKYLGNTTDSVLTTSNMEAKTINSEELANNTFDINCGMEEIICAKVSGKTGSFDGGKRSAVLMLRMLFDIKAIAEHLQKNTVIRFTTNGSVEIEEPLHLVQSGNRADYISVSSIFENEPERKKIDLWIFIASVVVGLLLLLLITFGLTKAGFFERSKKEELEQLKAQSGMEYEEKKPMDMESEKSDN